MSEEKAAPGKGKRDRSPSYPFIGLETAIGRLIAFDEYFKRYPALASQVGLAWKIKPGSSQAAQTVAALKSFGLVDYQGTGVDLKVVISDDGRNYLRAQQDQVKREILKKCALKPKALAKYWERWTANRPPDPVCLDELVLKDGFTQSGADVFLKVYDSSIAYAGLTNSDKVNSAPDEVPVAQSIKVGDFVQWECGGQLQFKVPRRIVEVLDAEFVRVEGSNSGIPIAQLTVVSTPTSEVEKVGFSGAVPATPALAVKEVIGMRQEVFSMTEGSVTIQWPTTMSVESFEDFKDWLKILERKVKRSVTAEPKQKSSDDSEDPA